MLLRLQAVEQHYEFMIDRENTHDDQALTLTLTLTLNLTLILTMTMTLILKTIASLTATFIVTHFDVYAEPP